nr:MAG TPA: hypothetical protein [Caudoviricetes sp.]
MRYIKSCLYFYKLLLIYPIYFLIKNFDCKIFFYLIF